MEFNVIFDTNILYTRTFDLDLALDEVVKHILPLIKFLEENNLTSKVHLFIPETVKEELVLRQKYRFEEKKKETNQKVASLKRFGLELDTSQLVNYDYEQRCRSRIEELLKKHNLNIIDLPSSLSGAELSRRFFLREKPFSYVPGKPVKGFKDTLIWETVLSFGMGNKNILFIHNNAKDFTKDLKKEFELKSGSEIIFLDSIGDLEIFLAKKFNIGSDFSEKRSFLHSIVKRNIGKLMLALHRNKYLFNGRIEFSLMKAEPLFFIFDTLGIPEPFGVSYDSSVETVLVTLTVIGHFKKDPDSDSFNLSNSFDYLPLLAREEQHSSINGYNVGSGTFKKKTSFQFELEVNTLSEEIRIKGIDFQAFPFRHLVSLIIFFCFSFGKALFFLVNFQKQISAPDSAPSTKQFLYTTTHFLIMKQKDWDNLAISYHSEIVSPFSKNVTNPLWKHLKKNKK